MQREIQYDEIFDAQAHYRLLLDSMARPGKINVMPQLELTTPRGIHVFLCRRAGGGGCEPLPVGE